MNLDFRELNDGDIEPLLGLYRQLQPDDPVLTDGSDLKAFRTINASDYFFLLGAFTDERLVGSTYINIIPNITRSASPYAVIENVITEYQLHNRGIGKALMAATLEFIWSKGCYKAMLMTGSRQESTHGFYRACGFDGTAKSGYVAYPTLR